MARRRSSSWASRGSGRRGCLPSSARRADARGHLVLSGSASELERDLPFWMFVDALDEYLAGAGSRRLDGSMKTCGRSWRPCFRRCRRWRRAGGGAAARAISQPSCGARAAGAAGGKGSRWCSCSTTCTGRPGLGRAARRAAAPATGGAGAARARGAAAADRRAPVGALERAHRAGTLVALERGADAAARPASCSAARSRGPRRRCSTRRAAAIRSTWSSSRARASRAAAALPEPRSRARRGGGAGDRGGGVGRGVGLLSEGARRVLEGAAVAGDPFEPELAGAAAGLSGIEAIDALDQLLGWISIRPRMFPAASASVTRSSAARSTRRRPEAGGSALTSAPPRARRPWRARLSTRPPRRNAAREGDPDAIALLRQAGEAAALRAPASAARWFAAALRLLPEPRPRSNRSSCCSPARERSPRRAGSLTATRC